MLAEQPAKAGSGGVTASYTFAEGGVYRVELNAVPAVPRRFAPFRVPFDLRVETSGAPTSSRAWFAIAVAAGAALLALAAWAIIRVLRDVGR